MKQYNRQQFCNTEHCFSFVLHVIKKKNTCVTPHYLPNKINVHIHTGLRLVALGYFIGMRLFSCSVATCADCY